jgi:hypothetical protein
MAKISKIWAPLESKWYDELRSIHPYREYQYDKTIQSSLATLFPEYKPIVYSRRLKGPNTKKASIPDFALIREDYKEWWIVEVERIEDNIAHVKQQIDNFTNGNYNSVIEADYLFEKDSSLDRAKLANLTQEIPKVLLLVDDMNSIWIEQLEEFEPTICILKQYRNNSGDELISISGDYPYIFEAQSHCTFTDAMNNLLKLSNPDVLNPIIDKLAESKYSRLLNWAKSLISSESNSSSNYRIAHKGQVTEWALIQDGENVYLQPLGPHSLRVNDSYVLRRSTTNYYTIEIN